jgi:hypothetical protein
LQCASGYEVSAETALEAGAYENREPIRPPGRVPEFRKYPCSCGMHNSPSKTTSQRAKFLLFVVDEAL